MLKKFTGLSGLLFLAGLILSACGENPTPTLIPSPTRAVTTLAVTTAAPTTVIVTTAAPTTVIVTTAAPTTVAPTTSAPTTLAATPVAPTTSAPTTAVATTVAPAAGGEAEIARGLAVFTSNGCAGCHGGAKASGGLGPSLVGKNYELSKITIQIRGGAGIMPAYGADKIPDGDIKAITSFINSIKPQ